ncbi:DUF1189 domain-containing protein [bacterium]|jgi:uncharacterized membrane protein|nr:DUF1189 domain-containing protein [bacterium]
MRIFKDFFRSLYDFSVYREIFDRKKYQIGYLIFLVCLFNLFYIPSNAYRHYLWTEGFRDWILRNIPSFSITSGALSGPELKNGIIYEDDKAAISFNMPEGDNALNKGNVMAADKDKVLFKLDRKETEIQKSFSLSFIHIVSVVMKAVDIHPAKSDMSGGTYSFSGIKDFSFDSGILQRFLGALYLGMVAMSSVFSVLVSACLILLMTVISANFTRNAEKANNIKLEFVNVFNLCLFAMGPVVVVLCMIFSLGLNRDDIFFYELLLAAIIYLYFLNGGLRAAVNRK